MVTQVFELDEREEATGVVHFYCSLECAGRSAAPYPRAIEQTAEGMVEETRCEACSALLSKGE